MNNKVYLLYPEGYGGNWLSNLIWALTQRNFNLTIPSLNYHSILDYPKSEHIQIIHQIGLPKDTVSIGSFCGVKSKFIAWINYYVKDSITLTNTPASVFALSNNASHRLSTEFDNIYTNNIKLDYDILWTEPTLFISALYNLLDQYNIDYQVNDVFVLNSVNGYKTTCRKTVLPHQGNIKSILWQGWCHALALIHNIDIPFNIINNYDLYLKFLKGNNNFFIEKTKESFIMLDTNE
jgi:hypothetical protein